MKKEMDFESFLTFTSIFYTFRQVCSFLSLSLSFSLKKLSRSRLDRRRSSSFINGFEADLEGAQGPPERPPYLLQCWYHILHQTPFSSFFFIFFFNVINMFRGSIHTLSSFLGSGMSFFWVKYAFFLCGKFWGICMWVLCVLWKLMHKMKAWSDWMSLVVKLLELLLRMNRINFFKWLMSSLFLICELCE